MEDLLKEIALIPNNTYNYSNSAVFYSLVNYSYQLYYRQVIQKCQEWLDGYDATFHKAEYGILSSRIGAKITNGVVNQIFGRGLIYVNGKNTTSNVGNDYISHSWAKDINFENVVKQMIGYCFPLGTALIKINKDNEGLLWCEPVRADYFFYSVDSKQRLTDLTTFVRTFQSTDKQQVNYCLVEHRYFKHEHPTFTQELNGKLTKFEDKTKTIKVPYVEYKVYPVNSTSNNNTLASNKGKSVNFMSLPQEVRASINECYSTIRVDTPMKLPFNEYLGAELFKNEGGDITHPSLPFGKPALFDLIASFMEYDLEVSYSVRDLFNSKGIVGIPKSLSQSQIVAGTGGNLLQTPYSQLNISGYEQVSGLDPNTQKPIITQFEMRATEHETKQNAILKSIATSIGMSPRVIASYLVNGNEKTAEQTHSEDDTVANWIKIHRQDYIDGLNRIVSCVLNYKGIMDNVEVRFASDGLVSTERQLEIISKKLELGLIDIEDAVRELNPDLDELQLKVKIDKALARQQQVQEQQATEFDEMFGDELKM